MGYALNVLASVRRMPVKAWVIAFIIPGGLVGMAVWISIQSAHKVLKRRNG